MKIIPARLPILTIMLAAGLLGFTSRCSDTSSQSIDPEDLFGTWDGATSKGSASLTFKVVSGIPIYEWRAEAGSFTDVLEGSNNMLSQGQWTLNGRVVSLFNDEAGPYACLYDDQFEITMDPARTVLILDHLGEFCIIRAPYVAATYRLRAADPS